MGITVSEKTQIMKAVKEVKALVEDFKALNDKVDQEQSNRIDALVKRVTALEKKVNK